MLLYIRTLFQSNSSKPTGAKGVKIHHHHEALLYPHLQELLWLAKDAVIPLDYTVLLLSAREVTNNNKKSHKEYI